MYNYGQIAADEDTSVSTVLLAEPRFSTTSKAYFSTENKIIITKAIFAVALLECFVLLFYQQEHTQKGLMAFPLQMPVTAAASLAWPLALLDLFVSITATNLDAADKLFSESDTNLAAIKTMMFVVQTFSWLTYLISSVPAGIPLLQLLTQTDLTTQRSLIPFVALFFSIPGAVFYALYNAKNMQTTFKAMHKWWENPLRPFGRIANRPVYLLHYFEALLRYLAVIGSRTATAIFTAQLLSPLCLKPYAISADALNVTTLGLMILLGIATFINVSMTRVIRNLTKLIDPRFDDIDDEQYKLAEKTAHEEIGAKFEALVTHVSSAITASGFALYASYGASKQQWEVSAATLSSAIVVGGFMFAKSLYVKHAATIYTHAINKNKEQSQDSFSELTETFESSQLKWFITSFNFCSCSAKALSFYSFLVGLSVAFAPLGHAFSTQELVALCLILAPESFKNSFILNQKMMNDALTSYLAKYAMESAQQEPGWIIARIFRVYFKSPSAFASIMIEETLTKRKPNELTSSSPSGSVDRLVSSQTSSPFSIRRSSINNNFVNVPLT